MEKYVKPDVYYENFELSRNVASCSINGDTSASRAASNHSSKDSCYFQVGVGTDIYKIFSNNSCNATESVWEEYCYQTGTAAYNFFSS